MPHVDTLCRREVSSSYVHDVVLHSAREHWSLSVSVVNKSEPFVNKQLSRSQVRH